MNLKKWYMRARKCSTCRWHLVLAHVREHKDTWLITHSGHLPILGLFPEFHSIGGRLINPRGFGGAYAGRLAMPHGNVLVYVSKQITPTTVAVGSGNRPTWEYGVGKRLSLVDGKEL